jgi:hypothetical protein
MHMAGGGCTGGEGGCTCILCIPPGYAPDCFLMLLFYLAIFFIWILVLAALEFEINSDSVLLLSSYVDPDLFLHLEM